MSDYHTNQIEVSLGRTLRELRQHADTTSTYLNNQIVFWQVVEDLRDTFERNNSRFDGTKFISSIMHYAGIESMEKPQEFSADDVFLQRARGYRTVEQWKKYFEEGIE